MDREKWLLQRRNCITGTDIAGIIGLSRWSSPMRVYMEKKGLLEETPDNPAMEWGRRLEQVIAQKFAEDNLITLQQGEFVQKGIFGGTPDYLHVADKQLLEIKTASLRSIGEWGESGTDCIPQHYITQVQWYLGLLDYDFACVAVLIGGSDYRVYKLCRNDRLIKILQDKATKFWNEYILADLPPPIASALDNNLMNQIFKNDEENRILDRNDLNDLAIKLGELKSTQHTLEQEIDTLQAKFKYEIGNNRGIKGDSWSVNWGKSKDSVKIDWKSVAEELQPSQELIAKYSTKVDGFRRFVFRSSF